MLMPMAEIPRMLFINWRRKGEWIPIPFLTHLNNLQIINKSMKGEKLWTQEQMVLKA